MARRYGIPYKGSKDKIAQWVVDNLPPAEHFYDLFAGGFAITHCAMVQGGKYKYFHASDIEDTGRLFLDSINGKYHNESRWISREDFFELKDNDPYIRYIWSFGNNGRDYLYAKEIEETKRKMWEYCFSSGNPTENRLKLRLENKKNNKDRVEIDLQSAERLQSLIQLEALQRLEALQCSYKDMDIKPNSVVYCDPPYIGTNVYNSGFNHEDFYQWLRTREHIVYISEYTMPDDFVCIDSITKQCTLSAINNSNKAIEKLFVHRRWADEIYSNSLFGFDYN